jgi:hypothetical protein
MITKTERFYLREMCKMEIRNFNERAKLWEKDLKNNTIDIKDYLKCVQFDVKLLNKEISKLIKGRIANQ